MKWRQSSSAKGDASREEFILTKEHPRIDEFLDGLAGRRGLDLRKHCDLDAAHFGRCNGDARRPLVKSILSRMGISKAGVACWVSAGEPTGTSPARPIRGSPATHGGTEAKLRVAQGQQ